MKTWLLSAVIVLTALMIAWRIYSNTIELPVNIEQVPETDFSDSENITRTIDYHSIPQIFMPTADRKFGVQVRKFASNAATATLTAQLEQLGFVSSTFRVVDEADAVWYVVVTGPYDDRKEADDKRIQLATEFAAGLHPTVIVYPNEETDN